MSTNKKGYASNIARGKEKCYNNDTNYRGGVSMPTNLIDLKKSLFDHFILKDYDPIADYESDIKAYDELDKEVKLSELRDEELRVFKSVWYFKNQMKGGK